MKNDNLRKGFTLAEIMVALVVIGIITSIILPVAYNNLPSEKVMKFKKGNAILAKVINELVMSGEYYMAGDLGTDNNGSGVSATYFCETFSDLVTTKRINCLNTDNGDYKIGMYRLEGMGSETLSDKKTSALKYVDSMCKQYHPKDKNNKETFEIITSDNVKFYTINPATTFSTKAPNASYDMFSPCLQTYKIMCMQVDDEIFGYGIRKDGRIMAGERALAWVEKSIQSKEDENNIEIQNIGLVNVAFSAADATNALSCKSQPYQNTVPDVGDNSSGSSGGSSSGGSSSGESSSGGNSSGGSSSSGSSSSGSGGSSSGSTSGGSNSSTTSSGGVTSATYTDETGSTYTYRNCLAADSTGCTKCSRSDMSTDTIRSTCTKRYSNVTDRDSCTTTCNATNCHVFVVSSSLGCLCNNCRETYETSTAVVNNATTFTVESPSGEKTHYYNCLEGSPTGGCTKCSSSEFKLGYYPGYQGSEKSCAFDMQVGDTVSAGSTADSYCTDMCSAAKCKYLTYGYGSNSAATVISNCTCNKCDESFTGRK